MEVEGREMKGEEGGGCWGSCCSQKIRKERQKRGKKEKAEKQRGGKLERV